MHDDRQLQWTVSNKTKNHGCPNIKDNYLSITSSKCFSCFDVFDFNLKVSVAWERAFKQSCISSAYFLSDHSVAYWMMCRNVKETRCYKLFYFIYYITTMMTISLIPSYTPFHSLQSAYSFSVVSSQDTPSHISLSTH